MDEEFRFVLLDFGHPMTRITIQRVINSLENILGLAASVSGHPKKTYFGVSFLNSDFTVLESESYIRKNYDKLNEAINNLLTTLQSNSKVTVPEYKHLLNNSIEMILRVSKDKIKIKNSCSPSKKVQVKVAIVTKKTASILMDILMDVVNKMLENFSTAGFNQKYKIVQIVNEPHEKTFGTSEQCQFIKWTTCSDDGNDFNCLFKDWFLNRPEKLQIQLSEDLNFTLQCEVENFMINPMSINGGKSDLYSDVYFKASVMNPSLSISKPVHSLQIINTIPVSNLCPTLIFGVPRRVSATRSASAWLKSQANAKIFEELCRELHQRGLGLLGRSAAKSARGELAIYHFLTSDGSMLLMNDVTPGELYLPKRVRSSEPNSRVDKNTASLVKSCIHKIKLLDEYSPMNHSSGLYQYLKYNLMQNESGINLKRNLDKSSKSFRKKRFPTTNNNSEDENCNGSTKEPEPNPEKELKNTHPALLPPQVVKKLRKVPSEAFNLPEFGKDFA